MATDLARLFGALAILVAAAALARAAARGLALPAVLGELTLGLLVGPGVLGRWWPASRRYLFDGSNAPILEAFAWVGLVLFMLTAGAEMRWRPGNTRAAIGVAAGGILVAGGSGALLAILRPQWFFEGPWIGSGVLVVAILMTVTALPVLARLLSDLDLLPTSTAQVALAAATLDDIIAWSLLALAAGASHGVLAGSVGANLAVVALVLSVAFLLDRLLTPVLARRFEVDPTALLAVVVAATFGAALLTQAAGLHAVVGALAVGALASRHPQLREEVVRRFQGLATVLLLPLFFILTVGEADLGLLANPTGVAAVAGVLAVASLGKIGGSWLGARLAGISTPRGLAVGLLMNARGAVGLVVAKVGLDSGLLSAFGFAVVVLVILLTTLLAAPLLAWHTRRVGVAALD